MNSIQFFGAPVHVGGTARILADQANKAVFDLNGNGQVDPNDAYVLTQNSVEGCTGCVMTDFDNLRAHVGPLGRASSQEVAESMTTHEHPGSWLTVTDLVPSREVSPAHVSTVFRFDAQEPYAEFIFKG